MAPDFDPNIKPDSGIATDPSKLDPNALPRQARHDRFASFRHKAGAHGLMHYDRFTLAVQRWQGYMGEPIDLPEAFKRRPQPFIATCSTPGPGNRGCPSAGGCQYVGFGPFNAIVYPRDAPHVRTSMACHVIWCGFTPEGLPN